MQIHDFARAAAAAVNTKDVDAVTRLWAEPAIYESTLTGEQRGLEALATRETELFSAFPTLTTEITPLGQDGDTGAMLVRMSGTHEQAYGGFPATGNDVEIELVAIVTFDDEGRVVHEKVVLDRASIAEQLTAS